MAAPPLPHPVPTLILLATLVGCASNGPPSGTPDTGPGPIDAGVDTGPAPTPDAGPTDAGLPDAGPTCDCPTLPATCAPPAADSPVFAPNDGPYGEQLMAVLACADRTLRAALYETDWSCIADAFAARLAADPDLVVELVIDDDQCPRMGGTLECALSAIDGHPRVTIVDDARSRLMHHKFISADGERVWVSSGNMTQNSFCSDFNNSIVVEQAEIVAGYEAQFDLLFTTRLFGPIAVVDPVTGGSYALYFSPETPVSAPSRWFTDMIAAIDAATTSVEFMISAFTRTEVSDALIAAAGRGVSVRGVVSHIYADDPPALALIAAGIPVRVDSVHSKVLLVDGHLVITGSPNWSEASWANNENSLWIDDDAVAGAYAAELSEIFDGASTP